MTLRAEKTKEDVLYAFSIEESQDPVTLSNYLQTYPQFRSELIDLSMELSTMPLQEAMPVEGEVSESVTKAWDKFQSMLSPSDPISLTTSVENPLVRLDKKNFRKLANKLNVSRLFLTRLRDRTIEYSSIPMRFIEIIADAIDVGVDTLSAGLDGPATVSSAQSFKSDVKPEASDQIRFEEAIDNSNLSEQQKTALREFKE